MKSIIGTVVALYALASVAVAVPFEQQEEQFHAEFYGKQDPDGFLKLTLRTRAGYCYSRRSCYKVENTTKYENWLIGRLSWFLSNGKPKTWNCSSLRFDKRELTPQVLTDLNHYWPSFTSSDNGAQWEDEFNVRGRCVVNQTRGLNSTLQYFNQAVTLYRQYNVSDWLGRGNIFPNDNKTYPLAHITDVIGYAYPHRVEFACDGRRNYTHVLQEIRLCFDKNNRMPIDCPRYQASKKCDTSDVWYLKNTSTIGIPSGLLVFVAVFVALFTSKQ